METEQFANSVADFISAHTLAIIIGAALVAFAIGGGVYYGTNGTPSNAYTVQREELTQRILFSGTLTPQSRVTLSFERAGRVDALPYDVGDTVPNGTLVAALDNDIALANRAREAALLASEEAALTELLEGTRGEEIAIEQAQVVQKEALLEEAELGLTTALLNAFTVADSSIRKTIDPLFDDPNTATPELKHNTVSYSLDVSLENQRLALEGVLNEWKTDVEELRAWKQATASGATAITHSNLFAAVFASFTSADTQPDFAAHTQRTRTRLLQVITFLEDMGTYTSKLSVGASLTQTQIDTFAANIATERTNAQTALTTLTTKQESYTSARQSLAVSTQELSLATAGTREQSIAAQQARVDAQHAALQSAEAEVRKHSLRAPRESIVTERLVELGELVTVGTPAIALDAAGGFEIDAQISELDVVLLREGMQATVTTDSLGPAVTFPATLTTIDPAETLTNNVPGYGVTLTLDTNDPRLKAGMTANVSIAVTFDDDALVVPIGYVETTSGGSFVTVLRNGKYLRIGVTLGAETADGRVAIIEGLSEGDRIVPYENE